MGRKAAVISIDVNAGTAKMLLELEKGKAGLRDFGRSGASSMAPTSVALRELEGNFANNTRGAARFLAQTLGLGPALQAAFPLFGAVAFGGMMFSLGQRVYDFFKQIQEAPAKISNAFRELNDPIRLTNDELRVTNDRLANDIAKLEGKRENTLKLALDEAKMAADKLADSLDKDIISINKLLKEENVGFWRKVLGEAGTEDIQKFFGGKTGQGGFRERINEANTPQEQASLLKDAMGQVQRWIDAANEAAKPHIVKGPAGVQGGFFPGGGDITVPGTDETARLEILRGIQHNLQSEMERVGLEQSREGLRQKKAGLESSAQAAELGKPFKDRMAVIGTQLDEISAKMAAIGQSESVQLLAKSFGEAQKAITEVNKALESRHIQLTEDQKKQIEAGVAANVAAQAELEWRTKLEQSRDAIQQRIRSTEMLTAAIGKSFQATRQASIESSLMQSVGSKYGDAEWMKSHQGDVAGLRSGFGAEFDAQHAEQTASATQKLREQVQIENQLAEAMQRGEEEIRRINALELVRAAIQRGASGQEIAAEVSLYYARQRTHDASEVAKINAEADAIRKLAAAQLQGAESARLQSLENKYAEMQRTGQGAQIPAERAKDEAQEQARISGEVARRLNVYSDEIEALEKQKALILEMVGAGKANADQERALLEIKQRELEIEIQRQLQQKSPGAGVRAFFLEMQQQAKNASQILYESLNSALDRVSQQMGKLLTGQKTSFGKMLQGLGEEMVSSSFKSLAQQGLSKLGGALGINLPGVKRTGNTPSEALFVQPVGGGGLAGAGAGGGILSIPGIGGGGDGDSIPGPNSSGGLFGSGSIGGGIFSWLSQGGIPGLAGGGDVDPGNLYVVGEKEPELFTPRGAGSITPFSRLGGGGVHVGYIDARGADLGAGNRVSRAIEAAHQSAVYNSVRANADRARRVPQSK